MRVSQLPTPNSLVQQITSEHLVMKDPHSDRLVAITAHFIAYSIKRLCSGYGKRTSTALMQILRPM
jgi:hypothetical protein